MIIPGGQRVREHQRLAEHRRFHLAVTPTRKLIRLPQQAVLCYHVRHGIGQVDWDAGQRALTGHMQDRRPDLHIAQGFCQQVEPRRNAVRVR